MGWWSQADFDRMTIDDLIEVNRVITVVEENKRRARAAAERERDKR